MVAEETKTLLRRFAEALRSGNLDLLDEVFALNTQPGQSWMWCYVDNAFLSAR